MSITPVFILCALMMMCGGCATKPQPVVETGADPATLRNRVYRIRLNPTDGSVVYLGPVFRPHNLLGPGGITMALVGMEPPVLNGELSRVGDNETRFSGVDQNGIAWEKHFRLVENVVHVRIKAVNRRDQGFDAIIYSLADLPEVLISGDNRDLRLVHPWMKAHFHAEIADPHFPGESMAPSAMRSDSKKLDPGESMEFVMTWELRLTRHE